jgi:hypothetical protein
MEIPEDQTPPPASLTPVELGAYIGKSQAFSFLARHCSAAEAQCLKRLRETAAYETLGLNWDQFCLQHLGISRSHADRIIHKLHEFGETYFQLAGITQISAESYRLIAPAVTGEGLEIDGEVIPITQENAVRIRLAVQTLRGDLRRARDREPHPDIIGLQIRLEACFTEMSRKAGTVLNAESKAGLQGLVGFSQDRLKRVAAALAD